MKILKYLYLSFITLAVVLPSCTSEPKEQKSYTKEMLYGRWEIVGAERNGNTTETLDSTYFEFSQSGQIISNFNLDGVEESGTYEFAENTIREKKTNGLSYAVDTLSTNQMTLLTQFMNFDFKLILEKK